MTTPFSHEQPETPTPAITQAAAEHVPLPIFQITAAGVICYANQAAKTLLQQPMLSGVLFLSTLEENSQKKGKALLNSAQAQPSTPFELNQCNLNGEIITISYRAMLLPQDQGMLLFGEPQAKMLSITEHVLEQNQHLHSLVRIATNISHTLDLNEQLHTTLYTLANEMQIHGAAVFLHNPTTMQLQMIAQYGMQESIANQPTIWEHILQRYTNSERDMVVAMGDSSALGLPADLLPSVIDTHWKLALTHILSDQHKLGLLLVLDNSYPPFRNNQIELLRTVGSLIGPHIENARLFMALRERTSQLQAIQQVLDGLDTGVLLTDTNGVVRSVNATMGKLLGQDISTWIGHPHALVMPELIQQTPQDQESFTGDLWRYMGPQEILLRRFHEMITDPQGQIIGAVEVFSDVTLAQHVAQMKDSFLSIAAHELKTPITAIKGYAQIALRMLEKQPESTLRTQMTMIDIISNELTRHMEDLLDVSRIQVGSLELDLVLTDLPDLINQVINTIQMPSKRQRRTIETSFPPDVLLVWWDAFRIERVLTNLINNAIKYSPDGGIISVGVQMIGPPGEQKVEITVTDFGIGIPTEERAEIFKRFYRARQAVQHGFKGTGIGLFLCREIVEAHSGHITAEAARHGGQGTTVAIQLPQDARHAREA